jgi:XTP/dITP diphosphohydrolase
VTATPITIVLATANADKAREIVDALGGEFDVVPRPAEVPEVEETGSTLEDNARLKAVALTEATGHAALADDTGLEVDALDGAPGVYSSRYSGEHATYADNVTKLLGAMDGVPADRRTARFRTVALVRFPDGRELLAEGAVTGTIASGARGEDGFGYDPVFVPDEGDGRTFAEMTLAEKNAISHRGRAVRAAAALLRGTDATGSRSR